MDFHKLLPMLFAAGLLAACGRQKPAPPPPRADRPPVAVPASPPAQGSGRPAPFLPSPPEPSSPHQRPLSPAEQTAHRLAVAITQAQAGQRKESGDTALPPSGVDTSSLARLSQALPFALKGDEEATSAFIAKLSTSTSALGATGLQALADELNRLAPGSITPWGAPAGEAEWPPSNGKSSTPPQP